MHMMSAHPPRQKGYLDSSSPVIRFISSGGHSSQRWSSKPFSPLCTTLIARSADITVLTSLTQSCEGRRAHPLLSVTVLGLPLMGIDSCWPAKRPSLISWVFASCVYVGLKAGRTVLCGNKRALNMYTAIGGSICGELATCVPSLLW